MTASRLQRFWPELTNGPQTAARKVVGDVFNDDGAGGAGTLRSFNLHDISDDDKMNHMGDEAQELDVLLSLDGASFEAATGYMVEFTVKRTPRTTERPHGISYALVFRPTRGEPYVRFDNAHAVERPGGRFVKASPAYDHWHRGENDPGRPYKFTTAAQLLDDFWAEVRRAMTSKGIPNDL